MAPRWATPRTPERPTYGAAVAAVSRAMGRPFMPHQRYVVDVALEVQSEAAGDPEPGEWAYDDVGFSIQRRGGKTTIIGPVVTHRAEQLERARIFMTAQNRDKARARWMDATDDLLRTPLRHDVKRKVGNMFEELRWHRTGSLFVPFAPNEDGLHSETPDLVMIDELWAFTAEQRRAIQAGYVPAFATSSGQAMKMSTAGTEKSAWLNAARAAGRRAVESGVRLGTFWAEWGLPDLVDLSLLPAEVGAGTGLVAVRELPDALLIEACIAWHPAICHTPGCTGPRRGRPCPHGFTARPAALRSAWTELDDRNEFLRAYGNRTQADSSGHWRAVAESSYVAGLTTSKIPEDAPVGLGVWVDQDGEDAAVVAGWRDPGGRMLCEVIRHDVGTAWVASYVAGVRSRNDVTSVAVANVGTARNVADQLAAGEQEVLRVAQADLPAATARHREDLQRGAWLFRASDAGYAGARDAVLVKVGGGVTWGRDEAPVSAWAGQALAGWAVDHAPVVEDLGDFWIR